MNSIKEIILLIKEKPALYLTGYSINLLNAFLTGWIIRDAVVISDIDILNDFQDWIENKYNQKGTQKSWAGIILFFSTDEYTALKNFFELFDEFLLFRNDIKGNN